MPNSHRFDERTFLIDEDHRLELTKRATAAGKELHDKNVAAELLAVDVTALQEVQQRLYANNAHSLLVIIQGMDAAGKDSTIRHVMSGVNPQGCRVYSFKAPNSSEVEQHFLWRAIPALPARGMISLFNRSYYEEVLVVRVHPEFLGPQKLPNVNLSKPKSLEKLWMRRFKEIRTFERMLADNGTLILKFFLHVSRDEQKKRLLDRLREPEKHWKFNAGDLDERRLWPQYQSAFEQAISNTSTKCAPWFVIPADDKWYARAAIADILAARLEALELDYPIVAPEELAGFDELARQLESE